MAVEAVNLGNGKVQVSKKLTFKVGLKAEPDSVPHAEGVKL